MRVSGFTFVRNAVELGDPVVEAIKDRGKVAFDAEMLRFERGA